VTRSPAELERLAVEIPPRASPARVRELLGEPLLVSELADGGETWLYVRAAPEHGRWDSLSVAFAADGGVKRLERKPAD
jgi:hypothetical protein